MGAGIWTVFGQNPDADEVAVVADSRTDEERIDDYCSVVAGNPAALEYIVSFDRGGSFGGPLILRDRHEQDIVVWALVGVHDAAVTQMSRQTALYFARIADFPTRAGVDLSPQVSRASAQQFIVELDQLCGDWDGVPAIPNPLPRRLPGNNDPLLD